MKTFLYSTCVANKAPSATTYRNHRRIIALTEAKSPKATRVPPLAKPLKYIAAEIVTVQKANEVSKGKELPGGKDVLEIEIVILAESCFAMSQTPTGPIFHRRTKVWYSRG